MAEGKILEDSSWNDSESDRSVQSKRSRFLDDARMIISKGRFGHAYVVVQLAIEELGKIVLLKEWRAEAAKRAGVWEISINRRKEWENHKFKAQKAWIFRCEFESSS